MSCRCGGSNPPASRYCGDCGAEISGAAVPVAVAADQRWYYALDGGRRGPVSDASIVGMIRDRALQRSTPVWREGMPAWVAAVETELEPAFAAQGTPPPLSGDAVDNTMVWTLAFAPILGRILTVTLFGLLGPPIAYWAVPIGLNVVICSADEKRLKRAGYDTAPLGSVFLVPVYLFKRAELLRQSNAYAIVWIATFALSFLGT